jgi:putative phosphoesterase
MMAVIGVISDTHGLLREEALARLSGVDHIIHGGDIGSESIIPALETIAPVTAIRGNVDIAAWCSRFPHTAKLTLFGRSIHVIHDRNDLDFNPHEHGVDVVISGHSHRPRIDTRHGVLYLNPGSAGRRRFKLPVTLATLEIVGEALLPQIHTLI